MENFMKSGGAKTHTPTEELKDGWGIGGPENTQTSYPRSVKGAKLSTDRTRVVEYSQGSGSAPGSDYPKKLHAKFGTEGKP